MDFEDGFDLKNLALPNNLRKSAKGITSPPRPQKGESFLKGPVPLFWLIKAAKLSGKVLHIALVLWYLAGLKNSGKVSLSNKLINIFGVERHAGYRALMALENAGLISVARHQGRCPRVTILDGRG